MPTPRKLCLPEAAGACGLTIPSVSNAAKKNCNRILKLLLFPQVDHAAARVDSQHGTSAIDITRDNRCARETHRLSVYFRKIGNHVPGSASVADGHHRDP